MCSNCCYSRMWVIMQLFNASVKALYDNFFKCFIVSYSSLLQVNSFSRASSVMDGLGRAVVGVWRAHTVLDESDGAESSPEIPDRFRKLRSSSSLNSLRMSMRKRLPLRSVQTNSLSEKPTVETLKEQPKTSMVRKLTRSAQNSFSGVCQVVKWSE